MNCEPVSNKERRGRQEKIWGPPSRKIYILQAVEVTWKGAKRVAQ